VKRRQASWFTAREMRHTDLQEAVSTLRGLESSFLLHVMRSGSNFPLQPIPTPDQALHQLAHEVIHLLAPHRSPPAVMLEEGLAVHFSVYAPTFISPTYRRDALSVSRPSGEWNDDDCDVVADGVVVGRIMKAAAGPVGMSWMWTLA
jgi:hypothetical protein